VVFLELGIAGSIGALSLIAVVFSASMLSFGMAITALSRTSQQLNTFVNVGGILFATVGGALVPISVLPQWVQNIAPALPTYWAMLGFRSVILDGGGFPQVVGPTLMLLIFTAGFSIIAAFKFRFEESKVYWG
jgi:ABC-2 type transport system permease protein